MNRRLFVQGLTASTLLAGCLPEEPRPEGKKGKGGRKKSDARGSIGEAPMGGGKGGDRKADPPRPGDEVRGAPGPRTPGKPEMLTMQDTVEGLDRTAHLYVPSSYDPNKKTPLLLGCHGRGMGANSVFATYGWREMCERRGWLAVFPESDHPKRDNRIGHDNNFFLQLMRRIDGTYNLNRDAVFGTGFSAGCHRNYAFASAHSEWVKCLAVSGGTVLHRDDPGNGDPAYHKAGPISVLHFHGGRDTSTPVAGGEKTGHHGETNYVVPLFESLSHWADYYGCTEQSGVSPPEGCPSDRQLESRKWTNTKTGVVIQSIIDPGLDHSWPKHYGVKVATRFFVDFMG